MQCRPVDPEAKGLVERANGYLERSFLPGRTFTSPADFAAQLTSWLARANERWHRALGCRPVDRLDADRAAMLALPPVAPLVGWRLSLRLPRDHYVRLDSNDYSVHPAAVGRRVDVTADLEHVTVTCAGGSWRNPQVLGQAPDADRPGACGRRRRAARPAAGPTVAGRRR